MVDSQHLRNNIIFQTTYNIGRFESTPRGADDRIILDFTWQYLTTLNNEVEHEKTEKQLRNVLRGIYGSYNTR